MAAPRAKARGRATRLTLGAQSVPRIEQLVRLFDSSKDALPLRTSERFENGHKRVGTGTNGKFREP